MHVNSKKITMRKFRISMQRQKKFWHRQDRKLWIAKIIAEAKEEAARILSRANAQVELERKAAADDMKKEMIALASLMAEKAVAGAVDAKVQDTMVESTLKEIGEDTWRK